MADAVAKAGAATVLVNARHRLPASGIVYAPNLVVTANHAVEFEEGIKVMVEDGTELEASLVGRDPTTDVAVLRLSQPAPSIAEPVSQEARPGQLVLALGRPSPNGIEASLGVVSAIGGPVRSRGGSMLERYLRTDTISYPGFSGGPLIDAAGRVVGMNTSGLAHGMGLTIPASLVWQLADSLAQHGRVKRGYLGVRSQPVEAVGRSPESVRPPARAGFVDRGRGEEQPGLCRRADGGGYPGQPGSQPNLRSR